MTNHTIVEDNYNNYERRIQSRTAVVNPSSSLISCAPTHLANSEGLRQNPLRRFVTISTFQDVATEDWVSLSFGAHCPAPLRVVNTYPIVTSSDSGIRRGEMNVAYLPILNQLPSDTISRICPCRWCRNVLSFWPFPERHRPLRSTSVW